MRLLILILISWSFAASAQVTSRGAGPVPQTRPALAMGSIVKSYREWKEEKIRVAALQVEQTRGHLRVLKARAQGSPNLSSAVQNLEQQVAQEEWNLEVARDLAVTDYLVLYLAQQGQPGKLIEAAGKLSAEETAQVLEAYIRSMGAVPSDSRMLLPASATRTGL